MRPALLLSTSLLVASLPLTPLCAQVQRLVDTIEAPIAYLCLEATPVSGTTEREPGPVQRLLTDPSLDALFRQSSGQAGAGGAGDGSGRALALVRGLLGRSSGELEIALTGILPKGGQPLLVLRARLQRTEADQLQMALDGNELAEPKRRLGGHTTYRLRGANKAPEPGQDVELTLAGADLVVGNDSSALREVLEPAPAVTSTGGGRKVLSNDPSFRLMKKQLPLAPGALWAYGDWQRLGQRLGAGVDGVPGWLMGSSGLGGARAVMASVASAQSDFTATLLLDFDAAATPVERRRPGRPGMPKGIDGWFAAVQPVGARTLLGELPPGGLGGLVLSMDLAALAGGTFDGSHLLHDLHKAFDGYGLDFDRNVMNRLGSRGTMQLFVGRGESAGAEPAAGGPAAVIDAVYSLRTKNKKAAADLFADLRRVTEPAGFGTVVTRDSKDPRDRRSHELLELRHRDLALFAGAWEDALLFANDADSLVAVIDELRRATKPRARRSEPLTAAVQATGGEPVAGLFDVDLQPLFDQITNAIAGTDTSGGGTFGAGARVDLSSLPKRHVGSLELQRRDDGTMVRVRVSSSH